MSERFGWRCRAKRVTSGMALDQKSHPGTLRRIADILAFSIIVLVSLWLPSIGLGRWLRFVVALGLIVPALYLLYSNVAAFVPSLFFLLNALMSPFVFMVLARLDLQYPQLCFLPPIVAYLIIVYSIPAFRPHVRWFKRGHANRVTIVLCVTLVLGSAIALIAWGLWVADDLSKFRDFIPDLPLPLLVLYGLGFAVFNSVAEEFISRAVMYDGFAATIGRVAAVIGAQAMVFALWHFDGFPGGVIGVVLVFVWSVFLGAIRHTSKGMLAPLVAHIFADSTIALILLFVLVVPR